MHRGVILHSLKSLKREWLIVLVMGILFGLFHGSLWRFVPTAVSYTHLVKAFGSFSVSFHSGCQQDIICGDNKLALRSLAYKAFVSDCLCRGVHMDLDVAVAHINLHGLFVPDIGICCPVIFPFNDGYVFAESVQVNGALGTDKPTAEDDNLLSKGLFRLMRCV